MSEEERSRRRTSLGRGLDALFGEDESYATLDKVRQSRLVRIEFLSPNPYQPRRQFDEAALAGLVDSIRQQGILQPILVRTVPGSDSHYQIIAGERRWRAAQQALLHEVPVVVRDISDVEALQIALIENVQRQDLGPLEEAEGYRRLMAEFGHTQEDLGRLVGKSRSHIANTLRLLDLPGEVQALLQSGQLTAGHARALLGCPDPVAAARRVVEEGLNVRQTEALAREQSQTPHRPRRTTAASLDGTLNGTPGNGSAGDGEPGHPAPTAWAATPAAPVLAAASGKDADTVALEREVSTLLGLRVSINPGRGQGGNLTIHYGSLEQLDHVLQRLSATTRG